MTPDDEARPGHRMREARKLLPALRGYTTDAAVERLRVDLNLPTVEAAREVFARLRLRLDQEGGDRG